MRCDGNTGDQSLGRAVGGHAGRCGEFCHERRGFLYDSRRGLPSFVQCRARVVVALLQSLFFSRGDCEQRSKAVELRLTILQRAPQSGEFLRELVVLRERHRLSFASGLFPRLRHRFHLAAQGCDFRSKIAVCLEDRLHLAAGRDQIDLIRSILLFCCNKITRHATDAYLAVLPQVEVGNPLPIDHHPIRGAIVAEAIMISFLDQFRMIGGNRAIADLYGVVR